MKNHFLYKSLMLILCVLFASHSANAYDFLINGIYYNKLSSNTVAVTFRTENAKTYSGSISIPQSVSYYGASYKVTEIGTKAFFNCEDLTSVTLPNTITKIGIQSFEYCSKLKSISIPSSVTWLGFLSFACCSSLEEITIPDNIETIPEKSFLRCTALKIISIGNGVKHIQNQVFDECEQIHSIYCWAKDPPTLYQNAFTSNVYSDAVVWVRYSSVNDYKTHSSWKLFSKNFNTLYDFFFNGYYFNKTGNNTLEFTSGDPNGGSYSGIIHVPQNVITDGVTYTVTRIGNSAFAHCPELLEVHIPESVTSMGYYIFALCKKLKSMTLPNEIKSIEPNVFYGCSGLETVTLGSRVNFIDSYAFQGCSSLTEVICQSLTAPTITSNTFDNSHYSTVKITTTHSAYNSFITANYWRNFSNIKALTYDFYSGGVYYNKIGDNQIEVTYGSTYYESYSGAVYIPDYLDFDDVKYYVSAIGDYAFFNCPNLTSVNISSNVKTIGYLAFAYCSRLSVVFIPKSVTDIMGSAFMDCSGLIQVNFEEGLKNINNYAFIRCTELKSVKLPNSVENVGTSAFKDCPAITSVELGSGLKTLGPSAFLGNTAIASVLSFAETPPSMVGDNSFTSAVLSDAKLYVPGIAYIDYQSDAKWGQFSTMHSLDYDFCVNGIYYKRTSLTTVCVKCKYPWGETYSKSVYVPSAVTYNGQDYQVTAIGEYAFFYCDDLLYVSIPSSVTEIGSYAFCECPKLASISKIPNVKSIGYYAFDDCTSLSAINLPDGLVSIAGYAFNGCKSLKEVIIPNKVTEIRNNTFSDCTALESVTLSKKLKTLHELAFDNCDALKTITCLSSVPPVMASSSCFTSTAYQNATLHVPQSSLTAYKGADWWRFFYTIVGDQVNDQYDVNGDGELSIADVNVLIDAILKGSTDLLFDVNEDGEIGIGDINALINAILQ